MGSSTGRDTYREQNRNLVIEVGEEFPVEVAGSYVWMTMSQMRELIKVNNYFNVEARSLVSCLGFV